MNIKDNPSSPNWTTTTKLVIGLTLAGILIMLVIRFQNIIAPILTSFLLAYLFYPAALFLNKKLKIPWRLVSAIFYILLFAVFIGLLTWGGISLIDQVQNLIKYIQDLISNIPQFFADISSKPLIIGPFSFDLAKLDLQNLWTQLLGIIQPILSQVGSLIGSLASGIGTTLTWLVFTLLISYFILAESNAAQAGLIRFRLTKYQEDMVKLGQQLGHIWNAFLRGQLLIFTITVVYYSVILGILGVRYFYLLALLAGLARFVPYVGPFVAWTTYGLVALFQTNYLGLQPFPFALLVVGIAWLSDFLLDNFVVPRVMSDALSVHPAAVLLMVIVSASLFGLLGMLLAAPVLASLKLILTYIFRKLSDQDPWSDLKVYPPPEPIHAMIKRFLMVLAEFFKKSWLWLKNIFHNLMSKFQKHRSNSKGEIK